MMVLENACEYKYYLGSVFDEMGFNGSFDVVDNNINLNIIPIKDNDDLPTKEQVLEKLKEIALKTKKQELENQINAICKEKIVKDFRSSVLGNLHAYDLNLEDQSNLQSQVSNAKNELMLKTIYKARGNYKDSLIYKRTLAKSQNSN
ncbi:hypothetical protein VN0345_09450 [Helicobacter pylori]